MDREVEKNQDEYELQQKEMVLDEQILLIMKLLAALFPAKEELPGD